MYIYIKTYIYVYVNGGMNTYEDASRHIEQGIHIN
jgi:hypothetical protein